MQNFVCDGYVDCENNLDEYKCDQKKIHNTTHSSTIRPPASECEHPWRLCDNKTKCISPDMLCDERPDCNDGSDEGMRCAEELCNFSLLCSHNCHNAPEGMFCSCPPHLHLQPDGIHCLETHPCEAWDVCSQKCIRVKSKYKCACFEGFKLLDDGFTCKSTDPAAPLVIFSNRHELRGVDLHSFSVRSLITSLKNTIALDFYHTPESDMVSYIVLFILCSDGNN